MNDGSTDLMINDIKHFSPSSLSAVRLNKARIIGLNDVTTAMKTFRAERRHSISISSVSQTFFGHIPLFSISNNAP